MPTPNTDPDLARAARNGAHTMIAEADRLLRAFDTTSISSVKALEEAALLLTAFTTPPSDVPQLPDNPETPGPWNDGFAAVAWADLRDVIARCQRGEPLSDDVKPRLDALARRVNGIASAVPIRRAPLTPT